MPKIVSSNKAIS